MRTPGIEFGPQEIAAEQAHSNRFSCLSMTSETGTGRLTWPPVRRHG
jgi:hypothetical protein